MLIENNFWHQTEYWRIEKFLAQFEIASKAPLKDGDIIEFGVFKGTSLIRLTHYYRFFSNKFNIKNQSEIHAFDSFSDFPTKPNMTDSEKIFLKKWISEAGLPLKKKQLEKILDNLEISNVNLIKGDIFETLPDFLNNNTRKFSMVHLDVDLYEVSKFILSNILPRMCKGGIIILDDYNKVEAATNAIDEFISKTNLLLNKIKGTKQPYYLVI